MASENTTSVTAMLGASIIRHVREAALRFMGASEGNIAVIFTIAALPIISFVGAAIDYSRLNDARSSMQAALDSTALMLSKDLSSGKITAAQVDATAQAYFSALYTDADAKSVTVSATYTANNGNLGNTIAINGSGLINTDFMKIAGFPTLSFGSSSTTAWGNVKMRVALALDNTGSMSDDGKITALRTAASNLIDQLSALAKTDGDVYISLIPFAKTINIGTSNVSADWIDWTDWLNPPTAQPANSVGGTNYEAMLPSYWHALGPGMKCPFTTSNSGFTCTTGPTSTSNASTIPSSGYICPSVDSNSHTRYNGCWTSTQASPSSGVFCSGSSNCYCPSGASSSCKCTGSGSNTSCTGPLYDHNWTQPNDETHNLEAPRVNAYVGFQNHQWNATTSWGQPSVSKSAPTQNSNSQQIPWQSVDPFFDSTVPQNAVQNTYAAQSTNPISTWTGCVTDRTQPYDAQGDSPTQNITDTMFPANQYYENSEAYCNLNNSPPLKPIMPMTYNWSTLKSNITAMQPTGGTNQAIGLAWAWQSLLTTGPIPAPEEDSNTAYNRVIILLSDGLNTEDRWPDYGNGNTQNFTGGVGDIDARQALMCQNIKNQIDPKTGLPMYTVYTIQVNTGRPADPTSTVLQNCASSPDKFFMLTSSNQIATTFTTIGNTLSELRVAR